MSNPLSDLVALIKVAKWAKEFSSLLYDFSTDASGTAWGEVQGFANQAMNFAHAVSAAHISLRRNCRDHPASQVLAYLSQDHVAAGITAQCKIVRGRLVAAVSRLDALMSGKSRILAFVKWSYHKGPILSILTDMEILKSTLNLLLTTIMVEMLGSQMRNESPADKDGEKSSKEKEEEISDDIRHLKKLVESHSKELSQLKRKLRREEELNVREAVAPELKVLIAQSLDSIHRVGDSIVATGQVPSNETTRQEGAVTAQNSRVYSSTRNDGGDTRTKAASKLAQIRMAMASTGVSAGVAVSRG